MALKHQLLCLFTQNMITWWIIDLKTVADMELSCENKTHHSA